MRLGFVLAAATLVACGGSSNNNDGSTDAGNDVAMDVAGDNGSDAGSDGGLNLPPSGPGVTQFHYDLYRTGWNRNETQLTPTALMGGRLHRDTGFAPTLDDVVYAQPLYLPALNVMGGMHDVLFVVTLANTVFALDALTGATLWHNTLASPMPAGNQPCGNISGHTGILGTPVIDPASRTLYVVSYTATGGATYAISGLDVTTGMQRTGYPQNIVPPNSNGSRWTAITQQERGAMLFSNGFIYVPFGGLYGDCGTYHGWVVQIDASNPMNQTAFATGGNESGIWAPGGVAGDGMGHVFVATGNGANASSMGDYVARLSGGASGISFSGMDTDFFQPSNWSSLDAADLDLGTVAPILLPDHTGSSTPHLIFTGGKTGVAHLLNRDNLGGTAMGDGVSGEGQYSDQVFDGGAWGGAATFSNGTDVYAFLAGHGNRAMPCTGRGGVAALHLTTASTGSQFALAWCSGTESDPNVPTVSSNGTSGGVLWTLGRSTRTLHAYALPDGTEVFAATGMDIAPSVQHWTPVVVVDGRVYVTGTNSVFLYRLM